MGRHKIIYLMLMFFSVPAFSGDSLVDIWNNNQAVDFLKQDKRIEAHEEFTKLLSEKPFHPLYQFNTGVSFFSVEDVDKAIKMNKETLKNPVLPKEISFASLYNLGVLYTVKGEIEKVLDFYQKALEIRPESTEIKTNIELLIQQKQGKGKGKGKKDSKNKSEDSKDDSDGEEQEKEPQKFQNQPKQFNSKEMSKSDVKKILEELKKQEQRIRAKHDRKGKREANREKNW